MSRGEFRISYFALAKRYHPIATPTVGLHQCNEGGDLEELPKISGLIL
jgi:hypothetical protein